MPIIKLLQWRRWWSRRDCRFNCCLPLLLCLRRLFGHEKEKRRRRLRPCYWGGSARCWRIREGGACWGWSIDRHQWGCWNSQRRSCWDGARDWGSRRLVRRRPSSCSVRPYATTTVVANDATTRRLSITTDATWAISITSATGHALIVILANVRNAARTNGSTMNYY